MPGLTIEALHQPWGVVLTCRGNLDQSTAESFRRELARHLWNGSLRVEIDLVAASFRDCSAVQPLLDAQLELRKRNGSLKVIAGPRSECWLQQLGLNDILECGAPRKSAVAAHFDSGDQVAPQIEPVERVALV